MTFAENLESARNGNKRAYGMLCNAAADRLYSVAYLVLDNAEDAENAVKSAFEDGFRGIGRINDENHLCAWLSRELTKHIVAKLKEYRAEEKTVKSDGSPEKDIFCRFGDLDRLVSALNTAFGYNVKELTVITSLKEETIERKLKDTEKKLGKDKSVIETFFSNNKAPDSLITKEPKVHDLTVEIDKTDDDELIGEMERIAAAAEAEESKIREFENNPRLIRFEPAKFYNEEEDSLVIEKQSKPLKQEKPAIKDEIEIVPKIKAEPLDTEVFEEQEKEPEEKLEAEKKEEPAEEEDKLETDSYEEEAVKDEPEQLEYDKDSEKQDAPKEIDARTFINVITSQRIKGKDFLKLMGNTRISNDVYREIEQNPNLTKERLIELLEHSSLTSADYYKVLTAVKQRNELIYRKEQAEKQVLFNIKDKKEQPPATDTRSFTAPIKDEPIEDDIPEKVPETEKKTFDFVKKSEPEIKPFMPVQDIEPDDEDEEDEMMLDDIPAPPRKETPQREKYKGREFFIDDDVYYPGVNNSKIIFCAVCAVLLIAGSFGIRYITTGSFLPGATVVETEQPKVSLPEEYLSDGDIYKAMSLTESVTTDYTSDYYKADGSAYSEIITKDFCETGNEIYIKNDGEIIAYSLSDNPCELYRFAVDETEREFLGFTALGNTFYMLYSDSYETTAPYSVTSTDAEGNPITTDSEAVIARDCVVVERYQNGEFDTAYIQDGDFLNAQVSDEAINIATWLSTATGAIKEAGATFLPSYGIDGAEKSYVGYKNITVPEKIGYNGFTVIGTLSGTESRAAAVLGGSQSFVEFNDDTCRVVISDKNKTYEENFRFVGSNLTLESTETYDGVCYGAEFIQENGAVTFDAEKNCVNVITESGLLGFELAEGETLSGAAFSENKVHITTQISDGTMLYCADLSTGEPVEVDADAVYSEKLKTYGENELLGLSVEADNDGNRTGLRLSVYGYDGKLTEKRYVNIGLDEQTDPKYMRYLYADAEENNLRIAVSEEGYIAVSTVYFDGVSEIERILCYKDDGTSLTSTTDLLLFDIQSDYRYLVFRDGVLYVVTDSRIITINAETGKATGYHSFDEETPAEQPAEEETAEPETTIE